MKIDRRGLKKRWSHTLTKAQRDAWTIYASFCPGPDAAFTDNARTGEEMYILCNLPKGLS